MCVQPETHRGERMDVHLPETNRGYVLLAKMGWSHGNGLGRASSGIVEPVRLSEQYGQLGLGKLSEYEEQATAATETRRAMTSELIATEDDAARQAREAAHDRRQGIADAIQRENAAFYCAVCDKQYTKVMDYENHMSSYDHHHKKRCTRATRRFASVACIGHDASHARVTGVLCADTPRPFPLRAMGVSTDSVRCSRSRRHARGRARRARRKRRGRILHWSPPKPPPPKPPPPKLQLLLAAAPAQPAAA